MIDHSAFCVLTADFGTRIHAFIVGTSFIISTVRILHAFWSTTLVRVAMILVYTTAHSVSTDGVWTAR